MTEEISIKEILLQTPDGEFASPFVKPAAVGSLGTVKPDGETLTVTAEGTLSGKKPLVNVTYAELAELKANAKLQEGAFYRITDYVTIVNYEDTRSAGHPFDIIIQAIGKNSLSDVGSCALHEGDTYFVNQNLSAWTVYYDINNDTNKYDFADSVNGKGVIYRMIDDKQNDLPYDFKNVQWLINNSSGKLDFIPASNDYWYTFTHYANGTIEDSTVVTSLCGNNTLCSSAKSFYSIGYNVFIADSTISTNFLSESNYNNIIRAKQIYGNTLGVSAESNLINCGPDKYFSDNVIGSFFQNNTIKSSFSKNIIKDSFKKNTIEDSFTMNDIGNYCQNNTFKGTSQMNTIGSYFTDNTVNCNLGINKIGDYTRYNTFGGAASQNNDIGAYFQYNSIPALRAATIYPEVKAIKFTVTSGTTLRNVTIKTLAGASPTVQYELYHDKVMDKTYVQTYSIGSDGQILCTWEENGVTVGRKKTSGTATEWVDLVPTIAVAEWDA